MGVSTKGKQAHSAGLSLAALSVALGAMLAFCRAFAVGMLPFSEPGLAAQVDSACSTARLITLVLMGVAAIIRPYDITRLPFACSGVILAASALTLTSGAAGAEALVFAVLAGVASGVVMLGMMVCLSSLPLRDIALAGLGGLVSGGLLIMGTVMAAGDVPAWLLLASGLMAGVLPALAWNPAWRVLPSGGRGETDITTFPWFAAVMFAISGFLPSMLYGMDARLGWNASNLMNVPLFVVTIVGVVLLTGYIVLQGEEVLPAIWVPLFAVALSTMVIVCVDDESTDATAGALLMAGVFSYHFLRWVVYPSLLSQSKVARLPFAAAILVITGSVFNVGVGTRLASQLPPGLQQPGGAVAILALLLSLVFAAALLVSNQRRADEEAARLAAAAHGAHSAADAAGGIAGLPAEDGAAGAVTPASALEQRCERLARERGLTPREAEIFLFTARGHSSTFIAEQLVISASTVRFHQQNIYRKLDIHSRQELLELVNSPD